MFGGFTDKDFDAYAPQKRKSNVFNRERLEVKQKLVALGREVAGGLNSTDGSPLLSEASVEHPALWNHKQVDAQHLYFSRNEGARKELDRIIDRARPMTTMLEDPTPQRNHVFLSITIDHERVEFALKLHPHARVDRQNLERKLGEHWEKEKLVDMLRSLRGGYHVGVTGHAHWLVVERSLPRAEATAAGPEILAAARRELLALLPIYHFIAWTRDNDFVSMREMLKQEKREKAQRGLARNDRVRIVRGMFAGRQGVVQEIDAKGGLRVQVGKVAVKLGADDVERSP